MLPLMACTCALRAVEPIPHIRITRRKTLVARIVMAAPGTKLSFVKEVLESNVCAWLSGVLTANRNRVAKRCWFQKRQERGTKKSLQMSCPGCFTFVKTVSRQAQTLNKLNRLLSQSVEAPRVSVTPYSAKKFAVTRCSLTTRWDEQQL